MKLLDPKKQDIGLYDSDTGRSLKVKHAVDLSDETPNKSKLTLLYTKAVRGEIVQIVSEGAFIHYFTQALKTLNLEREGIANFAHWAGMTAEGLRSLCLKHSPANKGKVEP